MKEVYCWYDSIL